jgi:hypothetical protein
VTSVDVWREEEAARASLASMQASKVERGGDWRVGGSVGFERLKMLSRFDWGWGLVGGR